MSQFYLSQKSSLRQTMKVASALHTVVSSKLDAMKLSFTFRMTKA